MIAAIELKELFNLKKKNHQINFQYFVTVEENPKHLRSKN